MSAIDDLSYCELRAKEVVNSTDGKRLGRIVDVLFSAETGCIRGVVVPMARRSFFAKNQEVFIPWKCVQKIGADVILVSLVMDECGNMGCDRPPPRPDPCGDFCRPSGDSCCPPPRDCCPPPPGGGCGAPPPKPPGFPDCDRRCEKCMLFDCAYRWT